jgi:N-glycosylase/DNA lyase
MGGSFMNLLILNRTIQEMCIEVNALCDKQQNWWEFTEEHLLREAAVCMFSSQMIFEVAEASVNAIAKKGLLEGGYVYGCAADYKSQLVSVLSEPITVKGNMGKSKKIRPRFKNRLASLLTTTIQNIHGQGSSLRKILANAKSAKHAREILVDRVWGFGPKQASLFLRRVSYCSDLAVLDTHVLDYMRLARGVDPKPSSLSRLSSYESIESQFENIALEFGYSVGCVDLATWITMRVAKREAKLWV